MMTFDEQYGEIASTTLRVYRKFGVSPADHDTIVNNFQGTWCEVERHVRAFSPDGYYNPPWPFRMK